MAKTLDCSCKGIEFTQSHRPGEAIPDSYDKCEPGFKCHLPTQNVSINHTQLRTSLQKCLALWIIFGSNFISNMRYMGLQN